MFFANDPFHRLQTQGMEKLFVLAPTRIDVPADIRHIVYIIRPQCVISISPLNILYKIRF